MSTSCSHNLRYGPGLAESLRREVARAARLHTPPPRGPLLPSRSANFRSMLLPLLLHHHQLHIERTATSAFASQHLRHRSRAAHCLRSSAMDESGFGGDDFISFDIGQEAGPSSPRPSTSARSNDRGPSGSRKRKADAERSLNTPETVTTKKERERAAARGTPWTVDVNWETARNPAQQLNREIIAFERWLSPTTAEHECRRMVIALIRKAICSQWRGAEVHSFGSQDTQLYLPQGDIDLVVVCPAMEVQRREGVLRSMAACLRRNNLAGDVQVIAKAKVPIIKFVCTYGKYRCDISVNQTNGLAAADYVNDMQRDMPVIRPLVLLVKHLLQQRGMSEVYTGGLGSFSVILMVINFCQVSGGADRGAMIA